MPPVNNKKTTKKVGFTLRNDGSLLTPEFRVSFPFVFNKDKQEKYGVGMVFPKDLVDFSVLENAIEEAISEKWPKKRPAGLMLPILDGDEGNREEYQGAFYINGKCGKYKPGVINADRTELTEPEEFYGGCWARAVITLYSWDNPNVGKRGVSVGVRSLMKMRDDEPFVGRVTAENDFDGVDSAAQDV